MHFTYNRSLDCWTLPLPEGFSLLCQLFPPKDHLQHLDLSLKHLPLFLPCLSVDRVPHPHLIEPVHCSLSYELPNLFNIDVLSLLPEALVFPLSDGSPSHLGFSLARELMQQLESYLKFNLPQLYLQMP